ncbi:MAG: hypothetical protein J6B06_00665 [Lachnospiraceae bacterium]|nr:hypothetical protein [Lachnospiraceae bacterium]
MNINGISNEPVSTDALYTKNVSTTAATAAEKTTTEDKGVVYESSANKAEDSSKTIYTQNTDLVNKLKADAEQKTAAFRQMVESMLTKQGKVFKNADDMWKLLAKGDFTVDKATAEAAQKEIAEDGYWGVEQTSDRILSFAEALTGGAPEKMESMREAFIKGYKQATGAWGRDLPDISQKTYDAVMKKFDNYGKEDDTVVKEAADSEKTLA